MTALNQNAKWAAIRHERISMGWYQNGDVVGLPVSPVDGYKYAAEECRFDIAGFMSRAPDAGSFTPGQAARPAQAAANGGAGNVFHFRYDIDETSREVFTEVSYYVEGGAETVTSDGCVKVRASCVRSSVDN